MRNVVNTVMMMMMMMMMMIMMTVMKMNMRMNFENHLVQSGFWLTDLNDIVGQVKIGDAPTKKTHFYPKNHICSKA